MANGKLRRGRPSVYQYPCHSRDAVFNSASPYRNSVAVEGRRGVLELQRAQMWGTGARSWGEERCMAVPYAKSRPPKHAHLGLARLPRRYARAAIEQVAAAIS